MSSHKTSKYVISIDGMKMSWRGRVPTLPQLEKFVMEQVVSTMPGYANEHIGKAYGIKIPSKAGIYENCANGKLKVEWRAPMFMVLPDPKDYPAVAKIR